MYNDCECNDCIVMKNQLNVSFLTKWNLARFYYLPFLQCFMLYLAVSDLNSSVQKTVTLKVLVESAW